MLDAPEPEILLSKIERLLSKENMFQSLTQNSSKLVPAKIYNKLFFTVPFINFNMMPSTVVRSPNTGPNATMCFPKVDHVCSNLSSL